MKRRIEEKLMAWQSLPERLPLLLTGARQVGKSYSVREFGRAHFDRLLVVNFEVDEVYHSFFEASLRPAEIIGRMERFFGYAIQPGKTLIFLDEIQLCERALTALKYFAEEAPEYHVIGAGSLLGVSIGRQRSAFPVGKVMLQPMFPMDFQEFLWAKGEDYLDAEILTAVRTTSPLPEALHLRALDLYRQYLLTGGMPASVATHIRPDPAIPEQDVRQFILDAYAADMAKHVDATQAVRIRACFDSIPQQLAKDNRKFQWRVAMKGGRAALLGDALDWLVQAGIVLKCDLTTQGQVPPRAHIDPASFKLYTADVGLLTQQMRLTGASLAQDSQWLGILAENYVAQTLAARGHDQLYWTSGSTAEVDFVLMVDGEVVPLEVKAGDHVRSRSLQSFIQRYDSKRALRLSTRNIGDKGIIQSLPLYAAHCI